jgi:hypothetical protein
MYQSWQLKAARAAGGVRYSDVLEATGIAVSMQQRMDDAGEIVTRAPGERKAAGTFDADAVERVVAYLEKRFGLRISKSGKRIELDE